MNIFRKAYSVAGAVMMLQFLLQLYLVAAAIFTIVAANDNSKDIYSASRTSTRSPRRTERMVTSWQSPSS